MRLLLCCLLTSCGVLAQAVSSLYSRGYTLIPEPQRLELKAADFAFDNTWRISPGAGVDAGDVAVETLTQELAERHQLKLGGGEGSKAIELAIRPGSVEIGKATDPDRAAVAAQGFPSATGPCRNPHYGECSRRAVLRRGDADPTGEA